MQQTTLFEQNTPQPLAARLRPRTLEEYVGQTHLLGPGKVLRRLIESDQISSIFSGARRVWERRPWHGSSPTAPRLRSSTFPP